jgi:hypothetical protein
MMLSPNNTSIFAVSLNAKLLIGNQFDVKLSTFLSQGNQGIAKYCFGMVGGT